MVGTETDKGQKGARKEGGGGVAWQEGVRGKGVSRHPERRHNTGNPGRCGVRQEGNPGSGPIQGGKFMCAGVGKPTANTDMAGMAGMQGHRPINQKAWGGEW